MRPTYFRAKIYTLAKMLGHYWYNYKINYLTCSVLRKEVIPDEKCKHNFYLLSAGQKEITEKSDLLEFS